MPMRLRFPLFFKKRGGRRSGIQSLGRAGEVLYQAMFVIAGLIGCWWLATDVLIPEWRLAREADRYVQTKCTVVDTRVIMRPGLAEPEYCAELLVEFLDEKNRPRQEWTRHGVGNDVPSEREARAALTKFKAGDQCNCWYDPQDPHLVTLNPGQRYLPWLVLSIPVSLVIAGVVGVARALSSVQSSPERQSDLLLDGPRLKLFGTAPRELLVSGLPPSESVNDSPGVRLAYRLPMYGAESWRVFGMATLCVLWNALVAVFVYQFVLTHLSWGWRLGVVLLVVAPLGAIGAWLVYSLWRDSRSISGVGVTQAELSRHPLRPGERCDAVLFQAGDLRARVLTVSLICEEIATYRQGTDTRTATTEVRREVLHHERFVKSTQGESYACEFKLAIPEDAPHSFISPHNEIRWSLEVSVGSPRWSEIKRRYRLCVYPPGWFEPTDESGDAEELATTSVAATREIV